MHKTIWEPVVNFTTGANPLVESLELRLLQCAQAANGVFCDAHVEFGKQPAWVGKTDDVRCRWNNDNQPHPETW